MAHAGPMTHQAPPPPMPKPPRKNPYREGISRSHQQYDLYEAIRNPNAPRNHRPPILPSNPEKPLSRQQLIEKKIQEKFEKNNYTVPGPGYLLIGKVLKVIFMTVTLPVYIVIYAIPKWFFVDLIPSVLKRVDNFFTAIERRIVNAVKRFFMRLASPFINAWNMMRNLVMGVIRPADKKQQGKIQSEEPTGFFMFIAMGLFMMIKPVLISIIWSYRTTQKIIAFVRSLPMRLHYGIQDGLQKFKDAVKKLKASFKKGLQNIRQAFHDRLTNPIRRNLLMPIYNWYRPKADYVKNAVVNFSKAVAGTAKRLYNAIKNTILHPVETTKNAYRHAIAGLKDIIYKAYKPIETWFLKKVNKIRASIKNIRSRMRQAALAGHAALSDYLKHLWQTACVYIKSKAAGTVRFIKNLPSHIKSFMQKGTDQVSGRVKILLGFIKAPIQIPLTIYKGISRLALTAREYLEDKILKIVKKLEPIVRIYKELTGFVANGVKFLTDKIQARLSPIIESWKNRFAAIAERFRIMLAWAHVLLRYGMSLVAQTAHNMGRWFN